jgi:nucleoside-diphosphate-sugar epimerase
MSRPDKSITVNEVLAKLASVRGSQAAPTGEAERAADNRHSLAGISVARKSRGFEVRIPFDDGLQRTVAALVGEAALV